MAEKSNRLTENAPGPYYVDDTCIDCDMCRNLAPGSFARHEGIGLSFVYHQPVTTEELKLAEEARQSCPTDSIGNDGANREPVTGSAWT